MTISLPARVRPGIDVYTAARRELREPWVLFIGTNVLRVRPASPRDLGAVGALHRRCAPTTLLDRYRLGGRMPTPAEMDRQLRLELSVVAEDWRGQLVAVATAERDPDHDDTVVRAGVLVSDEWQQHGIGTGLMRHIGGAARSCGYREMVTYPGTDLDRIRRMVGTIGRTRQGDDSATTHLHTTLPHSAMYAVGGGGSERRVS